MKGGAERPEAQAQGSLRQDPWPFHPVLFFASSFVDIDRCQSPLRAGRRPAGQEMLGFCWSIEERCARSTDRSSRKLWKLYFRPYPTVKFASHTTHTSPKNKPCPAFVRFPGHVAMLFGLSHLAGTHQSSLDFPQTGGAGGVPSFGFS